MTTSTSIFFTSIPFHIARLNMLFIWFAIYLLCFDHILGEVSVQKYCSDLEAQEHIAISQLTGMWFVVEVITHERDNEITPTYTTYPESCAVVTILDKPYTELSPLYKDYQYNHSYGSRYPVYDTHGHEVRTELPRYQHYNTNRNRLGDPKYRTQVYQKYQERKPLSISWDEDGATVAYAAYYTHPVGIWFIYRPSVDAYTPPAVSDHLMGMIQVLKAVGSHLVLTFCHRWPEEKLYTVLLSRSAKLNKEDVSGVHSLLRRKELKFVSSKKMCSLNNSVQFSANYVLILLTYALFLGS